MSALKLFGDHGEEYLHYFVDFLRAKCDELDSSDATRILTLLLLSEQQGYQKGNYKENLFYKLCDSGAVDELFKKALSDGESAMYLVADIMKLPKLGKLRWSLHKLLNEFIERYIFENEKEGNNFRAKLYASIIKNCFHHSDDVDLIKKLVSLIKETGCTEKLDITSAAHMRDLENVVGVAIEANDIALLRDLIEIGADISRVCLSGGYTPIELAILRKNEEMVNLLIQSGAKVNDV